MQYIIFGVIAVVGIAFLIIYNLRMDAKAKKAQNPSVETPIAAPPPEERNVQEKASDDAKVLVNDAREHGKLVEDSFPTRKAKKEKTTDFEYREALRTFQSGDEPHVGEGEAGEKEKAAMAPPPEQKPDDQFREAIRSLKK